MITLNLETSMQIGQLKKILADKGITDLDIVADYIQELKEMQCREDVHSYERYTESGSNSVCNIITGYNQKKQECIIWCTNHYLGLNRNKKVIEAAKKALDAFGTGCGTSAMSGGLSALHIGLENRIAKMLGKEKVLLFPTGYSANLGTISSVVGEKDFILIDRESHASIVDGCKLSGKKFLPFKHNDVEDLEMKLKRYGKNFEKVLVVVESAYSMSGDISPLDKIVELKKRYKFRLLVDEAHTFGFYGDKGKGYCNELGVTDDVDFIVGTLSKSTASIGGYVATRKKFCTMMRFSSSPYLFQACTPPADIAAVLASLDEIEKSTELIARLHENNRYFRARLLEAGFNLGASKSPVVPVYIPDTGILYNIERELYKNGIFSVAIVYPAVKANEGRLRFIVNAAHTREQIEKTVNVLYVLAEKYEIELHRPYP